MNDFDRFYRLGQEAEASGALDRAEDAYDTAWRYSRTVGEERLAWRALERVTAEDDPPVCDT